MHNTAKSEFDDTWQLIFLVMYAFDIHTKKSMPIYQYSFLFHHTTA